MPLFTVQDIVRATRGALVAGDLGVPVTGVSIDSRALGVGEAFFAIRGHRLDGHAFLADAAGRGAACLVVDTLHDDAPANVPLVLVEDTTKALGLLAAYHRARFSIPLVAVTGSNGKTTTKELIAGVLGVRWHVLKPTGSFNNQWGLPLTLLKLLPEHDALVLELGTNRPGEIAYLAELARPTVGAVTNVAAVHTEFLGSLDGVREEKAALVRAVPADGWVALDEIARGLAGVRPVAGRCVWREAGGVRILDDTYNANPVSVRAALDAVAARRGAGRLVAVLGDMLELGGIADEAHREIGRAVVAAGADELVGVGRLALFAVEAAREAGLAEARHATTFEDTVAHLLKRLVPGDTVLVKGSRGMRLERVVDALAARLARE